MTAIFISFVIITLINMLAYAWAYRNQSDHLTDISYSFCFITTSFYFLFVYGEIIPPRIVLTIMVFLWGLRLGGFLFYRICKMGKDSRFDDFRNSKSGFLKFWILQSVSIWIIALPVMTGLLVQTLTLTIPAVLLWLCGWLLESASDWQKFTFKSSNNNSDFINTGLYSSIRHPNYLGEILVWLGIFWYVAPSLSGWMWWSIISPAWVIILLVKVSGIPIIEKSNQLKYKDNPSYKSYLQKTWRLIPYIY